MLITRTFLCLLTHLLFLLIGYLLAKDFRDYHRQLMRQEDLRHRKVTAARHPIRISCLEEDKKKNKERKLREMCFYICTEKNVTIVFAHIFCNHSKSSYDSDGQFFCPFSIGEDYLKDGKSFSLSSVNEPVTSHLLKKDFSRLRTAVRHKVPLPFISRRDDFSGKFLKELYLRRKLPADIGSSIHKLLRRGNDVFVPSTNLELSDACEYCLCLPESTKNFCLCNPYFKNKSVVGNNNLISTQLKLNKECAKNFANYRLSIKEYKHFKELIIYLENGLLCKEEEKLSKTLLNSTIMRENVNKNQDKSKLGFLKQTENPNFIVKVMSNPFSVNNKNSIKFHTKSRKNDIFNQANSIWRKRIKYFNNDHIDEQHFTNMSVMKDNSSPIRIKRQVSKHEKHKIFFKPISINSTNYPPKMLNNPAPNSIFIPNMFKKLSVPNISEVNSLLSFSKNNSSGYKLPSSFNDNQNQSTRLKKSVLNFSSAKDTFQKNDKKRYSSLENLKSDQNQTEHFLGRNTLLGVIRTGVNVNVNTTEVGNFNSTPRELLESDVDKISESEVDSDAAVKSFENGKVFSFPERIYNNSNRNVIFERNYFHNLTNTSSLSEVETQFDDFLSRTLEKNGGLPENVNNNNNIRNSSDSELKEKSIENEQFFTNGKIFLSDEETDIGGYKIDKNTDNSKYLNNLQPNKVYIDSNSSYDVETLGIDIQSSNDLYLNENDPKQVATTKSVKVSEFDKKGLNDEIQGTDFTTKDLEYSSHKGYFTSEETRKKSLTQPSYTQPIYISEKEFDTRTDLSDSKLNQNGTDLFTIYPLDKLSSTPVIRDTNVPPLNEISIMDFEGALETPTQYALNDLVNSVSSTKSANDVYTENKEISTLEKRKSTDLRTQVKFPSSTLPDLTSATKESKYSGTTRTEQDEGMNTENVFNLKERNFYVPTDESFRIPFSTGQSVTKSKIKTYLDDIQTNKVTTGNTVLFSGIHKTSSTEKFPTLVTESNTKFTESTDQDALFTEQIYSTKTLNEDPDSDDVYNNQQEQFTASIFSLNTFPSTVSSTTNNDSNGGSQPLSDKTNQVTFTSKDGEVDDCFGNDLCISSVDLSSVIDSTESKNKDFLTRKAITLKTNSESDSSVVDSLISGISFSTDQLKRSNEITMENFKITFDETHSPTESDRIFSSDYRTADDSLKIVKPVLSYAETEGNYFTKNEEPISSFLTENHITFDNIERVFSPEGETLNPITNEVYFSKVVSIPSELLSNVNSFTSRETEVLTQELPLTNDFNKVVSTPSELFSIVNSFTNSETEVLTQELPLTNDVTKLANFLPEESTYIRDVTSNVITTVSSEKELFPRTEHDISLYNYKSTNSLNKEITKSSEKEVSIIDNDILGVDKPSTNSLNDENLLGDDTQTTSISDVSLLIPSDQTTASVSNEATGATEVEFSLFSDWDLSVSVQENYGTESLNHETPIRRNTVIPPSSEISTSYPFDNDILKTRKSTPELELSSSSENDFTYSTKDLNLSREVLNSTEEDFSSSTESSSLLNDDFSSLQAERHTTGFDIEVSSEKAMSTQGDESTDFLKEEILIRTDRQAVSASEDGMFIPNDDTNPLKQEIKTSSEREIFSSNDNGLLLPNIEEIDLSIKRSDQSVITSSERGSTESSSLLNDDFSSSQAEGLTTGFDTEVSSEKAMSTEGDESTDFLKEEILIRTDRQAVFASEDGMFIPNDDTNPLKQEIKTSSEREIFSSNDNGLLIPNTEEIDLSIKRSDQSVITSSERGTFSSNDYSFLIPIDEEIDFSNKENDEAMKTSSERGIFSSSDYDLLKPDSGETDLLDMGNEEVIKTSSAGEVLPTSDYDLLVPDTEETNLSNKAEDEVTKTSSESGLFSSNDNGLLIPNNEEMELSTKENDEVIKASSERGMFSSSDYTLILDKNGVDTLSDKNNGVLKTSSERDLFSSTDYGLLIPDNEDTDLSSNEGEVPNTEKEVLSSNAYDQVTLDKTEVNLLSTETGGILISTGSKIMTSSENQKEIPGVFSSSENDILEQADKTTYSTKEIIRTERQIFPSSEDAVSIEDISTEDENVDISLLPGTSEASTDKNINFVSESKLDSEIPDVSSVVANVDGTSDISLDAATGVSVDMNKDISTEFQLKTSLQNIPLNTNSDSSTELNVIERTSFDAGKIDSSTGILPTDEEISAVSDDSNRPTTTISIIKPKTEDNLSTTKKEVIFPQVYFSPTAPKSTTMDEPDEDSDYTSEDLDEEGFAISTESPEVSSTDNVKYFEKYSSSTSQKAFEASSTEKSVSSTTSSTSLRTSTAEKSSSSTTSSTLRRTTPSSTTKVPSSPRTPMSSSSKSADETTLSTSEAIPIPFHFTIDADYDEIVGTRKEEFEASMAKQLVVAMRIPFESLQNLQVSKGSIDVNFELVPSSEHGHMADEKALKAAADELKRMIDNGQLTINDLDGNTLVVIPMDPPTKAPVVNQTEHTTIILSVVIGAFILTVISVAIAAIIIKRKANGGQRLTPIEEVRSKLPSYREIPFQEALFMKGSARNKLMLGKYCYNTGQWMGPGPEPVLFHPPDSIVYRPPTDSEIRQTPRPPTAVLDSSSRNFISHPRPRFGQRQIEQS